MSTPPSSSSPALFANALPKLAGLTFLVMWGTQGGQMPMERVAVVCGALALFEALTAAAVESQRGVVEWSDFGAVLRGLLRPAALPLYAAVAAGVIFLGGEAPDHGRRMSATTPAERNVLPPRIVPTPRTPPSGVNPSSSSMRPGMPGGPPINYAPKGPTTPGGSPALRPTFTPSRPPSPAPAPPTGSAPQAPAPVRTTPTSAPTATAAPAAAPVPAPASSPTSSAAPKQP